MYRRYPNIRNTTISFSQGELSRERARIEAARDLLAKLTKERSASRPSPPAPSREVDRLERIFRMNLWGLAGPRPRSPSI